MDKFLRIAAATSSTLAILSVVSFISFTHGRHAAASSFHPPREWKLTVKIPPCSPRQNLELIWPKTFGGTVTIECNNL